MKKILMIGSLLITLFLISGCAVSDYLTGIEEDKPYSLLTEEEAEDIEEVRWMNHKEIFHALKDSYRSLGYVFDRYLKKRKDNVK